MPYSDLLRGRASIAGQIYLVTTVTHDRARLFTNLHLGCIVVRALHAPTTTACATTLAYVVMPDHLHWLVQLQAGKPKFHDRALRSDEQVGAVARYVVCNPIRAGLVSRLQDYPLWDAVWTDAESG
jgi:REP-associated tyrosine transposase